MPGTPHEKTMADGVPIVSPANATLAKDTGFQGEEAPGVLSAQPKKSPKARR